MLSTSPSFVGVDCSWSSDGLRALYTGTTIATSDCAADARAYDSTKRIPLLRSSHQQAFGDHIGHVMLLYVHCGVIQRHAVTAVYTLWCRSTSCCCMSTVVSFNVMLLYVHCDVVQRHAVTAVYTLWCRSTSCCCMSTAVSFNVMLLYVHCGVIQHHAAVCPLWCRSTSCCCMSTVVSFNVMLLYVHCGVIQRHAAVCPLWFRSRLLLIDSPWARLPSSFW